MIQQDAMLVKIETVGGYFQTGLRDGVRVHDHGIIREIAINFPETGAKGRLAEGADLEEIFDHAICRAETMVRNLKKMKSEHIQYHENPHV
jgi:hydroxymethylglutaryl-CoA reductase